MTVDSLQRLPIAISLHSERLCCLVGESNRNGLIVVADDDQFDPEDCVESDDEYADVEGQD